MISLSILFQNYFDTSKRTFKIKSYHLKKIHPFSKTHSTSNTNTNEPHPTIAKSTKHDIITRNTPIPRKDTHSARTVELQCKQRALECASGFTLRRRDQHPPTNARAYTNLYKYDNVPVFVSKLDALLKQPSF